MARVSWASRVLFSSSICPAGVGASTWNFNREEGLFPSRLEGLAIGSECNASDLRPFLDLKTEVRLMIWVKISPDCSHIPFFVSAQSISFQSFFCCLLNPFEALTLFHKFKDILKRADLVLVIHSRCPDFEIDSIGESECTMFSTIVSLVIGISFTVPPTGGKEAYLVGQDK